MLEVLSNLNKIWGKTAVVNNVYDFLSYPEPNPDPLFTGMDPRTRIRIRTKLSRIGNNDLNNPYIIIYC
jgi:hypothetical protein